MCVQMASKIIAEFSHRCNTKMFAAPMDVGVGVTYYTYKHNYLSPFLTKHARLICMLNSSKFTQIKLS